MPDLQGPSTEGQITPQVKAGRRGYFFLTSALIIVADQLSKFWVRANLAVDQSIPEEGWVRLTHVKNTGAAFGLFSDQIFPLTFTSLIGVIAILLYYRYPLLKTALSKTALGLLLGGAVGNLVDRLHQGYVTDFIDFGLWPVFNLADSAIVTGSGLLAYLLIRRFKAGRYDRDTSPHRQ